MRHKFIIVTLMLVVIVAAAPNTSNIRSASREWIPLNNGFPVPNVIDLAVEPSNTNVMYAVTSQAGIYRTVDGGSNWAQMNNGIVDSNIFCVFIDPMKPQTVYAGGYDVFKSTNRGVQWISLNTNLSSKVNCIRTDPSNSNTIYVGTDQEGIFKSTDGGLNWIQISQGLRDYEYLSLPHIYSIIITPSNHSILYACADDGIYKSTDAGAKWTRINNGLTQTFKIIVNGVEGTDEVIPNVLSASINTANPSNVYLGTNMGIFVTENGGESWTKLSAPEELIVSRMAASTNLDTILIGTDKGIFISKDYAKTWQKIGQDIIQTQINAFFADFTEPLQIVVATSKGIFESKDGGTSFTPSNKGLVYTNISHIIAGGDEKVLFAATLNDGLYKSSNSGENWQLTTNALNNINAISAAVNPNNNQNVLLGTDDGLYISKDGGETFDPASKQLEGNEVYSIVFLNSQIVLAGTTNGIFKSEDGGFTWKPSNSGIAEVDNASVVSIAFNAKNSDTIYAAAVDKGVFKSQDGGNSWSPINQNLETPLPHINLIAVDPSNPSAVYIASDGAGLIKSENGGNTWNRLANTPSPWVRDIIINPDNSKNIYASFYPDGVFATSDGGLTWTDISLNLPSKDVGSLLYKNNRLLASESTGVYELTSSYTIMASSTINGTIYPSGAINCKHGANQTFKINPNEGYRISEIKVDGVSIGSVSSYTFFNVSSDHTISATFEKLTSTTTIILQVGSSSFTVNGTPNTLDSPPLIKNGRTLLPIRAVIEALNGSIGWDQSTKKVTVSLGSDTIELWIGKSIAKVNDKDTLIDSKDSKVVPEIINGRTMLPIRFVAESLGCNVGWDGTTKAITITYEGH
ncbi:MAG: VPS10 domain-containing protein [Caldisericaceae bacterium]